MAICLTTVLVSPRPLNLVLSLGLMLVKINYYSNSTNKQTQTPRTQSSITVTFGKSRCTMESSRTCEEFTKEMKPSDDGVCMIYCCVLCCAPRTHNTTMTTSRFVDTIL